MCNQAILHLYKFEQAVNDEHKRIYADIYLKFGFTLTANMSLNVAVCVRCQHSEDFDETKFSHSTSEQSSFNIQKWKFKHFKRGKAVFKRQRLAKVADFPMTPVQQWRHFLKFSYWSTNKSNFTSLRKTLFFHLQRQRYFVLLVINQNRRWSPSKCTFYGQLSCAPGLPQTPLQGWNRKGLYGTEPTLEVNCE